MIFAHRTTGYYQAAAAAIPYSTVSSPQNAAARIYNQVHPHKSRLLSWSALLSQLTSCKHLPNRNRMRLCCCTWSAAQIPPQPFGCLPNGNRRTCANFIVHRCNSEYLQGMSANSYRGPSRQRVVDVKSLYGKTQSLSTKEPINNEIPTTRSQSHTPVKPS